MISAGPGTFYASIRSRAEVSFGNYNPAATPAPTGNGSVPASGANIVALTYRYVAGGARQRRSRDDHRPAHVRQRNTAVTNLASAYDGADQEFDRRYQTPRAGSAQDSRPCGHRRGL